MHVRISIRKQHDALINGGLRWVHASEDAIAYLRESKKETILVFASRAGVDVKLDLTPYGYKIDKTLYGLEKSGSKISIKSKKATAGIWVLR